MTQDEANALAFKREQNKSKFMTHKRWAAVHDSVKGWHVALIDNHAVLKVQARERARRAYMAGDMPAFLDASYEALLAGVRAEIEQGDRP